MNLSPINKHIEVLHDLSHVHDTNSHYTNDNGKEKYLWNHFATAKASSWLNLFFLLSWLSFHIWTCSNSITAWEFSILILFFEIILIIRGSL